MKVIFLDFDGVLNCMDCDEEIGGTFFSNPIVPKHVAPLNKIIELTGAKVILSTSHRRIRSLDANIALLEKGGFKGEVVGQTPILKKCESRHEEIEAWLKENPVEGFVILDDGLSAEIKGHFVFCHLYGPKSIATMQGETHTDIVNWYKEHDPKGCIEGGLDMFHVEEAVQILNKKV